MLAPESQMTWYVELLLVTSRNQWGDCKAAQRTAALSVAKGTHVHYCHVAMGGHLLCRGLLLVRPL